MARTRGALSLSDGFDPYAVLRVSPGADAEVIQAAYRTLARRHHPDHSTHPDAGARMAELNAAWEVLGDPTRRAQHDHLVRAAAQAPTKSAGTPERAAAHGGSSGYGAATGWHVGANGEGAAGPPPGRPSGTVLDFGRHIGWSLGEIARVDPGYLDWLARNPDGQRYRQEIEEVLKRGGHRRDRQAPPQAARRTRFGLPGR